MILETLKHNCSFKGRASRSEFWGWILGVFLVILALSFLGSFLSHFLRDAPFSFPKPLVITGRVLFGAFLFVAYIYVLVRTYALQTRRLHDIGWSGWWVFADYIFGCIVLIGGMAIGVYIVKNGGLENFKPSIIMSLLIILLTLLNWFRLLYSLFLLVLCCLKSQPEENRYGVKPFT
ncbi:MAG: DUF805 domain-containing protein [Bacteroidaceae bacterium]|nr:DUF805 domain-containing protein [Bacteroidaceae bacterium]